MSYSISSAAARSPIRSLLTRRQVAPDHLGLRALGRADNRDRAVAAPCAIAQIAGDAAAAHIHSCHVATLAQGLGNLKRIWICTIICRYDEHFGRPSSVVRRRLAGEHDALQAVGEPNRRNRLATAQRRHQIIVAAAAAQLETILIVDLEDRAGIIVQPAAQPEIEHDLGIRARDARRRHR